MHAGIQPTPIEPLSVEKRIEIAKRRGDDVLIAIIEEGYGAGCIREMWVPEVVRQMRKLEAQANSGDKEAQKTLRAMLLVYMPSEIVGNSGFIQGIKEANELAHR